MLQAKVRDEGWVDLLRYSNGLAGRFHKVSRRLEIMRERRGRASVGCGDGS